MKKEKFRQTGWKSFFDRNNFGYKFALDETIIRHVRKISESRLPAKIENLLSFSQLAKSANFENLSDRKLGLVSFQLYSITTNFNTSVLKL